MASYNRINLNSAHLIPSVALWQGPKLITALINASLKGSFLILVVWAVSIVMSATPVFNSKARERQNQYELCIETFKLRGSYTPKEFADTSTECWAQASVSYLQNETR